MKRRTFLKVVGAGGVALAGLPAAATPTDPDNGAAILVDLTKCAGCRMCEFACAEANGLPEPDWDSDTVDTIERKTSDTQWSVVNRHETSRGEVFVKRQCMHCVQPACASACLTKAMDKD